MAVFLDHMLVPAKDRRRSAELLATLLDVPWSETGVGPFTPVFVNDGLTLDFDQWDAPLPSLHYCFRMDDAAFDQVLGKLRALDIPYRSTPLGPADHRVLSHLGGRIVYWSEPDGHVWEALTVSYARRSPTGAAPAA